MITSSLPPELKVLIASGFLLGGGLFAQRYPADREDESVAAQPVVTQHNKTPASPTSSQQPATMAMAPGIDDGSRFEPIKDFVFPPESRERLLMSMSESGEIMNADRTFEVVETPVLDPGQYAGITVESSQETVLRPEYIPFQTSPVTMPEPNPAFFADKPTPPDLPGLLLSSGKPKSDEIVPGTVVAPSAAIQSGVSTNRGVPIAIVAPVSTTLARPAISEPKATADHRAVAANHNSSVIPPVREPRGNVIVTPARTRILPSL